MTTIKRKRKCFPIMLEKKEKAIKTHDRILAILVIWAGVKQNQRGFFKEAKGIGVSFIMTS